jgi:hypothetical protein
VRTKGQQHLCHLVGSQPIPAMNALRCVTRFCCCCCCCCSVAAKVSAEAEAERLRADNLALEARLRTMVAREVRAGGHCRSVSSNALAWVA